jgi:hypothetical protein
MSKNTNIETTIKGAYEDFVIAQTEAMHREFIRLKLMSNTVQAHRRAVLTGRDRLMPATRALEEDLAEGIHAWEFKYHTSFSDYENEMGYV